MNYKAAAWWERVLEHTGGHGADVILDCVGTWAAHRADALAR